MICVLNIYLQNRKEKTTREKNMNSKYHADLQKINKQEKIDELEAKLYLFDDLNKNGYYE